MFLRSRSNSSKGGMELVIRRRCVIVDELFSVETYATVFHLIANVTGILRPELTVMDLLEAAFPGGSITGAPKLRAMELIDELEHSRRNLYTGSMGYLSHGIEIESEEGKGTKAKILFYLK